MAVRVRLVVVLQGVYGTGKAVEVSSGIVGQVPARSGVYRQANSLKIKKRRISMVYQWKSGSCIKGDAQKSGELFEQLSATEEGLTARTLLDANKPEEAPLHNDYEWNDTKAAEEWRLHQSRHFINSIAIIIAMPDKEEPELVRAFHIVSEAHKYEPISAIVNEPNKYEILLNNALSELEAFKRKYNTLKELLPVFNAINEVRV